MVECSLNKKKKKQYDECGPAKLLSTSTISQGFWLHIGLAADDENVTPKLYSLSPGQ